MDQLYVGVKWPDDLLVFRGYRAMGGGVEGVKRGSGRVGIEVLAEGVGGDCSVIRVKEVVK